VLVAVGVTVGVSVSVGVCEGDGVGVGEEAVDGSLFDAGNGSSSSVPSEPGGGKNTGASPKLSKTLVRSPLRTPERTVGSAPDKKISSGKSARFSFFATIKDPSVHSSRAEISPFLVTCVTA
jgi:hypothetical protein